LTFWPQKHGDSSYRQDQLASQVGWPLLL